MIMNDDYFDDFEDDTLIVNPDIVEEETSPIEEPVKDPLEQEIEDTNTDNNIDSDIISEFLKLHGVSDINKILYENEDGEETEVSWNSLSREDRLGILQNINNHNSESTLDDSEIELINTIRNSKMSPIEYLQYVQKSGIDKYLQTSQTPHYTVDDYTDDDLFITDMIARLGDNVTDEEVQDALTQAKSNEVLYNKQIEALRNEYRRAEQDRINQAEYEKQQASQEQYNQFSQSIINGINSFNQFYGCDIEMDQNEKQELYEFITGFDDAGTNHFAKVLNDPELVVKMAWTVLNGEQLINDINDYYKSKISEVRKSSYEKGLKDANKKSESTLIIKPNSNNNHHDFIDDEF